MKKLISNTLSFGVMRIVTIALNLIVIPVLITNLGKDGYGILLLSQGLIGALILLDSGLSSGTVRFVAKYRAQEDKESTAKVVATSVSVYLLIGILNAVVFCALWYWYQPVISSLNIKQEHIDEFRFILIVAAIFSLFKWPMAGITGALRGGKLYKEQNYSSALYSISSSLLTIYLALTGVTLGLIFTAQQILLLPLWGYWLYILWTSLDISLATFRFDKIILKEIFSISSWSFLNKFSSKLLTQLDIIIISAVSGPGEVAIYNVLKAPIVNSVKIMDLATSATLPHFIDSYYKKGKEYLIERTTKATHLINALNTVICVLLLVFFESFMVLWVGDTYIEYLRILQVAVVLMFLTKSTSLLYQSVLAIGDIKIYSLITITTSILSLLLTYIFVSYLGGAGAILATYVALLIATILHYVFVYQKIGIQIFKFLKTTTFKPFLLFTLLLIFPFSLGIENWLFFVLTLIIASLCISSAVYYFILGNEGKDLIFSIWSKRKL